MTPEQHLAHLTWRATRKPWMDEHSHAEWKRYAWTAARHLAVQPALVDLPRLLTEAMQSQAAPTSTRASAWAVDMEAA